MERSCIPLIWFPLILYSSYIAKIVKLKNQHWYIAMNSTPDFWISPARFFFFFKAQLPAQRAVCDLRSQALVFIL